MGYYNRNVRATDGDGVVLVRIPIPDAEEMDLRIMPEADILVAIAGHVDGVPRLLFSSTDPPFQIHEYVEGSVVNARWPRGVRLPQQVVPAVVRLLQQLPAVPRHVLPAIHRPWPRDGDTVSFGRALSDATQRVYERFRERYRWALSEFHVPREPLRGVRERWLGMKPRPFSLVHADLHRKNMILTTDEVVFIDWELSLWGDPLYDLAVHISKMGYLDDEREWLIREWLRAMPSAATADWADGLSAYLLHEQVKDALVNCFRYLRLFEEGRLSVDEQEQFVGKLTAKIASAHLAWYGTDVRVPHRDIVRATLRRAARLRPMFSM